MRYPRHMTLELTAKCNFRCPYCYCVWHEHPTLAKPELEAAGWRTVLETCAADGVNDVLFTGGEALLRRDLLRSSIRRGDFCRRRGSRSSRTQAVLTKR